MRYAVALVLACCTGVVLLEAQGRGGPPTTAKAVAPVDLTGYWTAVVTEDWHVRMLTAPTGDFGTGAPGVIENPGVGRLGLGPNPSDRSNIPYTVSGAQAALMGYLESCVEGKDVLTASYTNEAVRYPAPPAGPMPVFIGAPHPFAVPVTITTPDGGCPAPCPKCPAKD